MEFYHPPLFRISLQGNKKDGSRATEEEKPVLNAETEAQEDWAAEERQEEDQRSGKCHHRSKLVRTTNS
jgi:hypothetical protein